MPRARSRLRSDPRRREQIATRIVFFIAGFGMASWAPMVPFVKLRAGVDERVLGLLLLCLGVGSIVTMPVAGALAGRAGCRLVIVVSAVLLCLALPLLATWDSLPLLVATLLVFGAAIGSIDVAMNTQAIIVERASGRPMMSGFHGLYSLGGIAGAVGMTALLSVGASPLGAVLCVVAGIVVALAAATPHLLAHGGGREGPAFALPRGIVLFIGILCFICFLAEGAVLDWGAVFLTSVRGMNPAFAGLGYAAFAAAMTIGRFSGDQLVQRLGDRSMIVRGGFCAALGFTLAALGPSWPVVLTGYALVGAGCSNIVPVLFTAAGRQRRMPENVAVAAVTTLGYAGILAGPAAIGFVAHATSLPVAFLMLALALVGVAACGRLLRA